MEAGEFGTVRDLAIAVNLAERHVSRQLRLAYLAPKVLKRLVYQREVSAVTVTQLADCALLSWQDQEGVVFGEDGRREVKDQDFVRWSGFHTIHQACCGNDFPH